MADLTITRGNTLPNSSSKTDFHNLIDQATGTVTNIVNADINSAAAIAASKLNLATVAQTVGMSSAVINEAEGASVASATTTNIWVTDGNTVHITGTTTITSLSTAPQAGAIRRTIFDGALILTNGANLILPNNGNNITTAAGDSAVWYADTTTQIRCIGYLKSNGESLGYTPSAANALAGSIVQTKNVLYSTMSTGTTAIPNDDTIPQNTEGDEYFTLAITPNSATNKLLIRAWAHVSNDSGSISEAIALFQDSTANALNSGFIVYTATTQYPCLLYLEHYMDAGTTSETTFKIRIGGGSGTTTINGINGARRLGGILISGMTIMEVKV